MISIVVIVWTSCVCSLIRRLTSGRLLLRLLLCLATWGVLSGDTVGRVWGWY